MTAQDQSLFNFSETTRPQESIMQAKALTKEELLNQDPTVLQRLAQMYKAKETTTTRLVDELVALSISQEAIESMVNGEDVLDWTFT